MVLKLRLRPSFFPRFCHLGTRGWPIVCGIGRGHASVTRKRTQHPQHTTAHAATAARHTSVRLVSFRLQPLHTHSLTPGLPSHDHRILFLLLPHHIWSPRGQRSLQWGAHPSRQPQLPSAREGERPHTQRDIKAERPREGHLTRGQTQDAYRRHC